jgi:hypothetical protein
MPLFLPWNHVDLLFGTSYAFFTCGSNRAILCRPESRNEWLRPGAICRTGFENKLDTVKTTFAQNYNQASKSVKKGH